MFIEDRAQFCDNCGLRLTPADSESPPATPEPAVPEKAAPAGQAAAPAACSVCGSPNVPGEMFCQNCGVQLPPVLTAPPPLPSPVSAPTPSSLAASQPPASQPPVLHAAVAPLSAPPEELSSTSPSPAPPGPPPDRSGSLHRQCPNCGTTNPPDEQYCQNCGLQLESAPAAPEEPVEAEPPAPATQTPASASLAAPAVAPAASEEAAPSTGEAEDRFGTAPLNGVSGAAKELYITGKLLVRSTKAEIDIPPAKIELTLGRSDPVRGIFPDIDLTPHGGDTGGVSRLHARLVIHEQQLYVEDLRSTNYTFLNRQRLEPEQRYAVKPGDEIRLGLVVLEYHAAD